MDLSVGNSLIVKCPKGATSQIIGNKRKNIDYLKNKYGFNKIKVIEENNLNPFDIEILKKEEGKCI